MVAIDIMGGDYSPNEIIKGALKAAQKGFAVNLFGTSNTIEALLNKYDANWKAHKIVITHTTEIINMDDEPSKAVKKKQNSSLVQAVTAVKKGVCNSIISAGNSGALIVASILILGKKEGVSRPAIASFLQNTASPVLLLDLGANSECKSLNLIEFAIMGKKFYEKNISKTPKIGLLSNGHESVKGTTITKEAFIFLQQSKDFNFIGYVEPYDIFQNKADVIISDGFTGNILLKAIESTYNTISKLVDDHNLEHNQKKSLLTFLSSKMDYRNRGGAPLLGINGNVIVCHGQSDAYAIQQAIKFAHNISNEKQKLSTFYPNKLTR
jgi:phosphate acyltransferase